jgi:hypothetical protein
VESDKRQRQFEHLRVSELKCGGSEKDAKPIAAATTNKTRRKKGKAES